MSAETRVFLFVSSPPRAGFGGAEGGGVAIVSRAATLGEARFAGKRRSNHPCTLRRTGSSTNPLKALPPVPAEAWRRARAVRCRRTCSRERAPYRPPGGSSARFRGAGSPVRRPRCRRPRERARPAAPQNPWRAGVMAGAALGALLPPRSPCGRPVRGPALEARSHLAGAAPIEDATSGFLRGIDRVDTRLLP